ncbi:glycoside hydrolase N-terminal domain-containing protein [Planctomycetota bacterium]
MFFTRAFLGTLLLACPLYAADNEYPWKLWYEQPAEKWVEALPVGNGRLGAIRNLWL